MPHTDIWVSSPTPHIAKIRDQKYAPRKPLNTLLQYYHQTLNFS